MSQSDKFPYIKMLCLYCGICLTIILLIPINDANAEHVDPSCFNLYVQPPPNLSDWRFDLPDLKEGHALPSQIPKEVQFLRDAVKQGFPIPKEWEKQLQGIEKEPIVRQLLVVNLLVNGTHFIPHQPGGWKYPQEFLKKGGDCEDFAITKYVLLRKLNLKADNLRIVVVKSTRGAKEYHMVVVVKTGEKPADLFVLDIEHDNPRSLVYCDDFNVYLSMNENKLWRHGTQSSGVDPREKWGGCAAE